MGTNAGWWAWITFVTEVDLIEDHYQYLTFDILLKFTQDEWNNGVLKNTFVLQYL